MSVASVTQDGLGGWRLRNFIATDDGNLHSVEPYTNAVIMQIFDEKDADGVVRRRRVFSVMCKDDDLLPALLEEAELLRRSV